MTESEPTNSVDAAARADILARLAAIEAEDGVRVLFACESGSRGWGFASPDSDYDVRFVYIRPMHAYLTIDLERQRDVIDRPIVDAMDLHGWDIRKTLKLLTVSCRPLLEWLTSPIVYVERQDFRVRIAACAPAYFSAAVSSGYYLKMARAYAHPRPGQSALSVKSLLYSLRALLAVRWLQDGRGPVPMPFMTLVTALIGDAALQQSIVALVEQKRALNEQDAFTPPPDIAAYIAAELDRCASLPIAERKLPADVSVLNELFRDFLEGSHD